MALDSVNLVWKIVGKNYKVLISDKIMHTNTYCTYILYIHMMSSIPVEGS